MFKQPYDVLGRTRTIDARSTRRIDDPPKLLIAEMRPSSPGTGIGTLDVYRNDLIKLGVRHVLEPITHALEVNYTRELSKPKPMATHPLSRNIPALFTRMVTPPKAWMALCITAAPSVTEDVFTTALPPAGNDDVGQPYRQQICIVIATTHAPRLISSTTFCAASPLKSFTTTLAPRAANKIEYLGKKHDVFA